MSVLDRLNPPQATRLQPVVRRVCLGVSTMGTRRVAPHDVGRSPHEMLIPGNVIDACFTGVMIKVQFVGNGDVSGWQGKRNRPCWKTSTEWQRRETVANHAAGIAPSAPTRSLGITQCGSTESRENNRIHLGPQDRNGSLGAQLVNGRVCPEAAPLQWWQSVHKTTSRVFRAALGSTLFWLAAAGCDPATGVSRSVAPARPSEAARPDAAYVGSASCRDCHEHFHELWATSRHGLAMQPYTPDFARRELSAQPTPVTIGARAYRAEVGPDAGDVRETGAGGEKAYPIVHVLGGKNAYYFLTPLDKGRLQVLPVAYDVPKKTWYDTAASGVRHFPDRTDSALDWTDRMFAFNTTCFNCHVSQLATNYDLATDTYRTTWAEAGISCESCHGPAAGHVRVMSEGKASGHTSKDIQIIRTKEFTAGQMNDMCATCHAKMVPISTSFRPGDAFFDHYDLVTLEHPDYYPDGRDLGENYTFTSWLKSPCVVPGKLDCNHCHTASGRPRFEKAESNRSCLPCHKKTVDRSPTATTHPAARATCASRATCPRPASPRWAAPTIRCSRRRPQRPARSGLPTRATSATPTRTPRGPTDGFASGTPATTRRLC
jgi:Cytochrome c554 and c-prime